jgi:hypothetical protein
LALWIRIKNISQQLKTTNQKVTFNLFSLLQPGAFALPLSSYIFNQASNCKMALILVEDGVSYSCMALVNFDIPIDDKFSIRLGAVM